MRSIQHRYVIVATGFAILLSLSCASPKVMEFPNKFVRPGDNWTYDNFWGYFVRSLAVSPDGEVLAAGYSGGTVLLWNTKTRSCTRRLTVGSDWAITAFSPDGRMLATGFQNSPTVLWDTRSWQAKATLNVSGQVLDMAFSHDGSVLATANYTGKKVEIWNTETGKLQNSLSHDKLGQPNAVAFSSDDAILATASYGRICLFNSRTLELIDSVPTRATDALDFSPDGQFLASGSSQDTVKLWQLTATGAHLKAVLGTHDDAVTDVRFSPDGRLLASISGSSTLKLWDVFTGQCLKSSKLGTGRNVCGPHPCLAFAPDGGSIYFSFEESQIRTMDLGNTGGN